MPGRVFIGCAGWSIPRQHGPRFPASGSHLQRYAGRFTAVEINSSFYRPHRRATYERWADAVPNAFAFAVKAPRAITHELRLIGAEAALDAFLQQAAGLGARLGVLLLQLPPSLGFDPNTAAAFFAAVRARFDGNVACEPRHPGWFTAAADDLLVGSRISRVAADPPIVGAAAVPGGWRNLLYLRLHGSPRIYYSEYRLDQIDGIAQQLIGPGPEIRWCIFDNTAAGAAVTNALALQERFGSG